MGRLADQQRSRHSGMTSGLPWANMTQGEAPPVRKHPRTRLLAGLPREDRDCPSVKSTAAVVRSPCFDRRERRVSWVDDDHSQGFYPLVRHQLDGFEAGGTVVAHSGLLRLRCGSATASGIRRRPGRGCRLRAVCACCRMTESSRRNAHDGRLRRWRPRRHRRARPWAAHWRAWAGGPKQRPTASSGHRLSWGFDTKSSLSWNYRLVIYGSIKYRSA